MADLSFLAPPQRVQLIWSAGDHELVVNATLRAVEDGRLSIRLEKSPDGPEPPDTGAAVQLRIPTDSGLYTARCEVVGSSLSGGTVFVEVRGEIERVQRRQFLRANVEVPTSTGWRLDEKGKETDRFALRVLNLSGGGVFFECFDHLNEHDDVLITFALENDQPISARVRIIGATEASTVKTDDGESTKYQVRGYFARILDREQQKIVQHIFKMQTARRRM